MYSGISGSRIGRNAETYPIKSTGRNEPSAERKFSEEKFSPSPPPASATWKNEIKASKNPDFEPSVMPVSKKGTGADSHRNYKQENPKNFVIYLHSL